MTTCLSNGTRTVKGTLRADDIDNTQVTVNDLAMGDYLKGVVPRESPASWGTLGGGKGIEALKAQSVSARSYAAAENRYPGVAKTCDTTACQVYNGSSQTINGSTVKEEPPTNTAVDATAGEVRFLNGVVARSEFSSSTGGYTAGGTFPAVSDEGDATASNPNRTWTAKIGVDVIEARYPKGTLNEVRVLDRNGLGAEGGRVLRVRLVFSGGNVDLTGDQFRSAFSLKSDWFTPVNVASFPYHVVTRDGGVFSFGGAQFRGSLPGIGVRTAAHDITEGPGGGYWILGEDGGVFSFDVPFHGSMGGQRFNSPVVGMEATAARQGYWLVAGDGGIFTFGDAPFFGSTGNLAPQQARRGHGTDPQRPGLLDGGHRRRHLHLRRCAVPRLDRQPPAQPAGLAMAPTPSGQGYWLVAKDGGIFTFGDATFQGSLPGRRRPRDRRRADAEPLGLRVPHRDRPGSRLRLRGRLLRGGPADVGGGPSPAVGAGRVL